MIEVSGRLRAARERAGLTIEDVSARTKIKSTFLHAIEREEFDHLPGEFFTRAFLRTYARELRLPPDDIVAAYDARFPPEPSAAAAGPASTPGLEPVAYGSLWPTSRFATPALGGFWAVAALVTTILVIVTIMNRPVPAGSSEPPAVGTTGVAEAPAPTVSSIEESAPEKLTIDIRPSRVIWVAGAADGERVIYRLVEPGERVTAEARGELWFRVGDADAFEYSINGSPGKSIGRAGEVREFRITRENFRSFYQ